MRILITGSEGVLGSVLKEELRNRGHVVFGCDLFHSDDPQYMRADISERRQVTRVFEAFEPQLVYNFAAEFGRKNGQEYYEQLWKTNCLGLRNVIEECVLDSATLAHASSSEAYGLAELYNAGEKLDEGLLEVFPPQFHNEYALTKWTNERQITMAARNNGLKAVIFRFFNVYGPPETFSPYRSVVCQLAYKLLANKPIQITKDGYRSHLWIGDWANAVANLANSLDKFLPEYGVQAVNIGGDDYTSIEELFNRLMDIVKPENPKVTFIQSEKDNTAVKRSDNTLSKRLLGYETTMNLNEGLKQTVEFLRRAHGL